MHEEPQVPNFLSRSLRGSGDFRIEPGLVIAVEPMVNMGTKRVKMHRDHWTQSTLDRKPSAHFEHTIAVTKRRPGAADRRPRRRTKRPVCRGTLRGRVRGKPVTPEGMPRFAERPKSPESARFQRPKTRQFSP